MIISQIPHLQDQLSHYCFILKPTQTFPKHPTANTKGEETTVVEFDAEIAQGGSNIKDQFCIKCVSGVHATIGSQ